jgi:hypothetical protein
VTQKVLIDLDSEPELEEEGEKEREIPVDNSEVISLESYHPSSYQKHFGSVDTYHSTQGNQIQFYVLVSDKFRKLNETIDHLMIKNTQKMAQMQSDIKSKKKETRRARNFSKRFVSAIRNEIITSIDRDEANGEKPFIKDRGERIKQRASSQNVVNRMCKSSRHEEQPILWEKIIRNNQW